MVQLRDDYHDLESGQNKKCTRTFKFLAAAAIVLLGLGFIFGSSTEPSIDTNGICPQFEKVLPKIDTSSTLKRILQDETFRNASMQKLGAAVRVPTEVGDTFPSPKDSLEEWKQFVKFHAFLEKQFPSVYKNLKVENVNTYGLVFTWEGSESELKPMLFTGHQDVVPVNKKTIDQWEHPPFSGYYDGTYLWGRGSFDCKHIVIGLMETVELLLSQDFRPTRTIILAFGFDEESSGKHGASNLAPFLLERYGENGIYAMIDEGMEGLSEQFGVNVFAVGTGEKGRLNTIVELNTPGGHSSIPPKHTSIGISAEFITLSESNPFDSVMTERNPMLGLFQCVAVNSNKIPSALKKDILTAHKSAKANKKLREFMAENVALDVLQKTTQAFDLINGGVKSNALPETCVTVVNSRIAIESSIQETLDHFVEQIKNVANKYDLGVVVLGKEILPRTSNGYFNVTIDDELESAPVSPLDTEAWKVLSGSIKHFFEDVIGVNEVIVAPSIMSGNTDTRYYWDVTENIYRFTPSFANFEIMKTVHSINEHVSATSHMHFIAFMYEFMHTVA